MKTQTIVVLWILFLPLFAIESIQAENSLRERIYIQTDKQVYLAGEQLWLKLYLTDAQGNPQSLSKIGYVELIDENMPQTRQKIAIENGTGSGMLMLPSQLATGYYRLIAYTRYMQNEGETVYFQKYIGVVNTLRTDRRIRTDTSLYVQPVSSGSNNLSVSSSNDIYATRMQGEIRIDGLPNNVHSLAVSVAGEEFIPLPDEEPTLPAWKQTLSSSAKKDFQPYLLPEYEWIIISGQLVDAQTGEPTHDKPGMILGVSDDALRVSGGEVHDNGQVSFHTGQITGRHKLGIAFFPGNDHTYNVKLQSPFAAHTLESPPRFALNPAWEERLIQRSVGVQVMYTYLLDSLYLQSNIPLPHIRWKPDYSYILDEYNRFDRLNTMFIEFIPYLGFHTVSGKRLLSVRTAEYTLSGNSLMLLDGVPVNDAEFFYNLNTRVLKRVDVYRGRFFIAGHIFDGIGSFISFDNNCPGLQSGDLLQLEEYEGTQPGYRFYAPSYTGDNKVDERERMPDYRHTLLWDSDIQTNGQHSIIIPFSTSDLTGDYRIIVEGLTSDGQPLRGAAHFRVN